MSDNQFVSSFIVECVNKGISSADDICNEAIKQIEVCDSEINKADKLRIKKDNLAGVLRNFGHESTRRMRGNKIDISSKAAMDQSSVEYKQLMVDICSFLNENENIKASDIIQSFGGYEEQHKIYSVIKSLGELDLIERDEDGFIIPGLRWEDRPR